MKNHSEMPENPLVDVLKKYDFNKHHSHKWLLKKRAQREAILKQEGLDHLFEFDREPIHIGNIVISNIEYDWGYVVFDSLVPELDRSIPCSVYGAFDFLIRKCQIFPMYISVMDVRLCAAEQIEAMPVFGMPYSLEAVDPRFHSEIISSMLRLHRLEIREQLLVDNVVEVSDADLFNQFFGDYLNKRQGQTSAGSTTPDSSGYDGLVGRDF